MHEDLQCNDIPRSQYLFSKVESCKARPAVKMLMLLALLTSQLATLTHASPHLITRAPISSRNIVAGFTPNSLSIRNALQKRSQDLIMRAVDVAVDVADAKELVAYPPATPPASSAHALGCTTRGTVTETDGALTVEATTETSYKYHFVNVFEAAEPTLADYYREYGRCLAIMDSNLVPLYGEQMKSYFAHHGLSLTVAQTG